MVGASSGVPLSRRGGPAVHVAIADTTSGLRANPLWGVPHPDLGLCRSKKSARLDGEVKSWFEPWSLGESAYEWMMSTSSASARCDDKSDGPGPCVIDIVVSAPLPGQDAWRNPAKRLA